jgi:DNA-binding LacI/PurR family transcriptional regulator
LPPEGQDSVAVDTARSRSTTRSLVTIKDVARAAQVSQTTVSNLLNGRHGRMSPETQARITEAMATLGYHPSRVARNLRTGQAPAIGLVVPSVANPFWGSWAYVLEAEAMRHNLQVLLCNSERDPERERAYVEELRSSGVRAIVLGSSLPSLDHLDSAFRNNLTLLAFDREPQGDDEHGVINLSVDNFAGGRMATEHLLSLGHRRIGFISGAMKTVSRRRRLAGYESALAEYGLARDDSLIWVDDTGGSGDVMPSELGTRGMLELLDRPTPPTGVVTINDMYALGACAALRDVGRPAPLISVTGFDDITIAPLYNPPLTTVRQPLQRMAQYAIRAIQQSKGAQDTELPRSVLMQPTLIPRESTTRCGDDTVEGESSPVRSRQPA